MSDTPTTYEDPGDEITAEEAARTAAFDADPEWNGHPLHPFSSGRESIFSQLRLSVGAPPLEAVFEDVDAFFADAIRILYLCSHAPEDWRHLRRRPAEWQEAIEAWGVEAVPTHRKQEALRVGMNILTTAYRNQHVPAPAKPGQKPGKP